MSCLNLCFAICLHEKGVTLGCGNELGEELWNISYVNKLGPRDARNHQQGQSCCLWCCHSGLMWVVSISASQVVFIKRGWHLGVGRQIKSSHYDSTISSSFVLADDFWHPKDPICYLRDVPKLSPQFIATPKCHPLLMSCLNLCFASCLHQKGVTFLVWHWTGIKFGTLLKSMKWVLGMPKSIDKVLAADPGAVTLASCELSGNLCPRTQFVDIRDVPKLSP